MVGYGGRVFQKRKNPPQWPGGSGLLWGNDMGGTAQREEDSPPLRPGEKTSARNAERFPNAVVYSLVSGAAAALVGAAAALTVSGFNRIAIWSTVSAAASVALGLAWDSAAVSSVWSTVRRSRRGSSSSSGSS